MDRILTDSEFEELKSSIKLQLEIDGIDVYVTDIQVHNKHIKVAYFCKEQHLEEQVNEHVHDCIKTLIKEQECTPSKTQSSPILSRIKNTLLGFFRT